jgi:phosphoribosylaminoimidazole (AIR) synthetase
MREAGLSLNDCVRTFNWGIGFYIYVPEKEADRTIAAGKKAGYDLIDLGGVEPGERRVIFEPEKLVLPPVE